MSKDLNIGRATVESLDYKIKDLSEDEIDAAMDSLYTPKTAMFDHQKRAFLLSTFENKLLYAIDMGLGKTKLALDIISHKIQKGECKQALVIAKPTTLSGWEKQIEQHSYLTGCIINDGNGADKANEIHDTDAQVVIISTAWILRALSVTKSAKLKDKEKERKRLEKLARDKEIQKRVENAIATKFNLLIFDEVHDAKNPKSVAFKSLATNIENFKYKYFLTGTPVGNSYTNLWAVYFLLDGGETYGTSYQEFLNEYFEEFSPRGQRFVKYHRLTKDQRKINELFSLFWSYAVRWEEAECNELPEKIYKTHELHMTEDQEFYYNEIRKIEQEKKDLDDGSRSNFIFKYLKVLSGNGHENQGCKGEKLRELLNTYCIEDKQRVIIWHTMIEEAEAVEAVCDSLGLKYRTARGETTDKTANIQEWKDDNDIYILIASLQSVSVGVELTESNICIYYGMSLAYINMSQSEKRIHRTGQTKPCIYHYFLTKGTVDLKIYSIVKNAGKSFKSLMGDATK